MPWWPAIDVQVSDPDEADLVEAFFLDHELAAIEEPSPGARRYFFRTPAARDAALPALRQAFSALAPRAIDVDDENWVARSQAALTAVRVGAITVAPPWDAGTPDPLTIIIRPAMGFGTGHHATTRLCLGALQALAPAGRSVLDVGTGSGVLAIAANRLGASPVDAIDDDPDALEAAQENLALNPGAAVRFAVADFRTLAHSPVHVLVANLTGALLVAGAPALRRLVHAGGTIILSGFPVEGAADVRAAFADASGADETREDEWAALTLSL
jgi:ribosomal protein L11 methyltransferase